MTSFRIGITVAACLLCGLQPDRLLGQTVRGRVADSATHQAVSLALVTASWSNGDTLGSTLSDTAGVFAVRAPHGGKLVLKVVRAGYRTVITEPLDVGVGDILSIQIDLPADPFALDSMVIEAQRGPLITGTLVDAFHERRFWLGERLGLGTFLTRDHLDARNAVAVSDVLRTIPSLRLTRNPETGGWDVTLGASSLGPGKGCRFAKVYVDGVWVNRMGDRNPADNDVDLMTFPDMLEGIEVYRGAAQMPAEFGGPAAQCGVVAMWTRRGR